MTLTEREPGDYPNFRAALLACFPSDPTIRPDEEDIAIAFEKDWSVAEAFRRIMAERTGEENAPVA